MKKILNEYKIFDLNAHSLRGKTFFKEIFEYRNWIYENRSKLILNEPYPCFLCKNLVDLDNPLILLENYKISQCEVCMLYSPNIKIADSIVYSEEIYVNKQIGAIENHYNYRKDKFGSERLEYLKGFIEKPLKELKVLDIGCGAGYFIDYAREHVKLAVGTESSDQLIERVRDRGLNVTKLAEINETFDVITLFDVLEHLEDPINFFRSLTKKLDNNGIILAYTPNIESLAYALMEEKQNTLLPFEHYCFFNKKSLEYLSNNSSLVTFVLMCSS